jgi:hypothetical protein
MKGTTIVVGVGPAGKCIEYVLDNKEVEVVCFDDAKTIQEHIEESRSYKITKPPVVQIKETPRMSGQDARREKRKANRKKKKP